MTDKRRDEEEEKEMTHQELIDQVNGLLPREDYGSTCITIESWRRSTSEVHKMARNEVEYNAWTSNGHLDIDATSPEGLVVAVREFVEKQITKGD